MIKSWKSILDSDKWRNNRKINECFRPDSKNADSYINEVWNS